MLGFENLPLPAWGNNYGSSSVVCGGVGVGVGGGGGHDFPRKAGSDLHMYIRVD